MKRIVALTGAGISAESGLQTFRGENGLWEGYAIEDVATPKAWAKNPAMVQHFYNLRRKAVIAAEPNAAHFTLAQLEKNRVVDVITQNIDDLHERAGSTKILHLHGEIMFSRSSINENLRYPIKGTNIEMGETCEMGSQLRPDIVWFGEEVPLLPSAARIVSQADIVLVIGTSLVVYPAAGLINYAPAKAKIFVIDPNDIHLPYHKTQFTHIKLKATEGLPLFVNTYLPKL